MEKISCSGFVHDRSCNAKFAIAMHSCVRMSFGPVAQVVAASTKVSRNEGQDAFGSRGRSYVICSSGRFGLVLI